MISVDIATPADAAALAEMLNELDLLEGNPGGRFSQEVVLRDGFGADPAFFALLARHAGRCVGYLLWYPAYDTDLMARKMWVSDIYVRSDARGLKCGVALMKAAAQEAVDRGYQSLDEARHAGVAVGRDLVNTLLPQSDELSPTRMDRCV